MTQSIATLLVSRLNQYNKFFRTYNYCTHTASGNFIHAFLSFTHSQLFSTNGNVVSLTRSNLIQKKIFVQSNCSLLRLFLFIYKGVNESSSSVLCMPMCLTNADNLNNICAIYFTRNHWSLKPTRYNQLYKKTKGMEKKKFHQTVK